ncbi:MAG: DMT family transporter [Bacillota bacterium]
MINRYYTGVLLVILSAVGFAFLPIFGLYAYGYNVSVQTLLFYRFLIASIIFFSYIFLKGIPCKPNLKQLISLFILGGVLYTIMSNFYLSSVKYIPASLAALLLYAYPIVVTVLAFFIEKEKASVQNMAAIGLCFVGLYIVLRAPFENMNYLGVFFALGAAAAYGLYIVFSRQIVSQVTALVSSAYVTLFASLSLFIIGIFLDTLNLKSIASGYAWLHILGVALCSTAIAVFTFFIGVNLIGSTKASIISTVEPLVTIILSTLLLGEKLSMLQLAGGLLVLGGAVLAALPSVGAKEKVNNQMQAR